MVFFDLPLVDPRTRITDAAAFLNEVGVWALIIQIQPDNFRLIDFRDLVAATDPSLPLSAADHEPVLAFKDIPDLGSMNAERFRAAMGERQHQFVVRDGSDDTADVVAISKHLADIYLGDTPGKRCTRPNKPAGMPSRQWYHYYPPMTPSPAETCSEDGSVLR